MIKEGPNTSQQPTPGEDAHTASASPPSEINNLTSPISGNQFIQNEKTIVNDTVVKRQQDLQQQQQRDLQQQQQERQQQERLQQQHFEADKPAHIDRQTHDPAKSQGLDSFTPPHEEAKANGNNRARSNPEDSKADTAAHSPFQSTERVAANHTGKQESPNNFSQHEDSETTLYSKAQKFHGQIVGEASLPSASKFDARPDTITRLDHRPPDNVQDQIKKRIAELGAEGSIRATDNKEAAQQQNKREQPTQPNPSETRRAVQETPQKTHPEQKAVENKFIEPKRAETQKLNPERPSSKEIGQAPKEPQTTKAALEQKIEARSQSQTKEVRTEKAVVTTTSQVQEPVQKTKPVQEKQTPDTVPQKKFTEERPVQEPARGIQKAQETPAVIERVREVIPPQTSIKEREVRVEPKVPERTEAPIPQVKSIPIVQEREIPRYVETREIPKETPRTLTERVEKEVILPKPEREPKIEVPVLETRRTPEPPRVEQLVEARVIQEITNERIAHQSTERIQIESEAPILEQLEYTHERLEERVEERIESRIEAPDIEIDVEPTIVTELAGRASDDAAQLDQHEDLATALKELNEIVDQKPDRILGVNTNIESQTTIQLSPAETEFLETLRNSHGLTIETLAELQSVLRSLDNSYVPEAVVPEVQQELKHILNQVAHTLAQQVQDGQTPKNIRDLIPNERIRKLILDALHEIQLRQRLAELEANPEKGKDDNTIKKITKEVIQEIKKLLQIDEPIEDFEIELDPDQEQELQDQDLEQESRETQPETEPEDAYRFEEELEDRDLAVYEISGQVINLDTGIGLPGVTIFGGLLGRATTDLYGFYAFKNVPKGTGYTVGPDKPGYRFTPEAVSGTVSMSVRHDFVGKRRRRN